MAYGVSEGKSIRLHQALHGYEDGHRLLATSVALKSSDEKIVLLLSDASGPGAAIPEEGYLTGYPVAETGLFALARTWSAPEMPRPGCVWTHTLFIDFADLATLPAMELIAEAFLRPSKVGSFNAYTSTLSVWSGRSLPRPRLSGEQENLLRRLLWALYSHPKDRIIFPASESASNDESLVFMTWNQQWPRLRRTFRFCTLTFTDRSTDILPFDLQGIPPSERVLRAAISGIDASQVEPPSSTWLDLACEDLMQGGGRLRAFLRNTGSDVQGGRDAFAPLCEIYRLTIEASRRPAAMDEAVKVLKSSFSEDAGGTVRTFVANAALADVAALDDQTLDFLVENLSAMDNETIQDRAVQVGKELWKRNPRSLFQLPNLTVAAAIANDTLSQLSVEELVRAFASDPTLVPLVAERRRDIYMNPMLWNLDQRPTDEVLRGFTKDPEAVRAVVQAMLQSGRSGLSEIAKPVFGRRVILDAVVHSLDSNKDTGLGEWIAVALGDPEVLAQALSEGAVSSRSTLEVIARATHPDFVPNKVGEDPWWTAVRRAVGDISEDRQQYLAAYLVARGLGGRSRNPAEIISSSFDYIYTPALESRLTHEAWSLVESRLPWSMWWPWWDRCKRLRAALVDLFIERELSPKVFLCVTNRDVTFAELAAEASETKAGRALLRRVRRTQASVSANTTNSRLKVIERLL